MRELSVFVDEPGNLAKRRIPFEEILWVEGLPVTCAERTLVDLCLDYEDPSIVEDAFDDALRKGADSDKMTLIADGAASERGARDALSILYHLVSGTGSAEGSHRSNFG